MNTISDNCARNRFIAWSRLALVTTVIALLAARPGMGQPQPADPDVERQITHYMESINNLAPFNGLILVARHGRIIVNRGYGMAAFEFQISNTPKTRFRIASVTKPITATAVMLLVEQGRLAVTDPINKHLPNCPNAWKEITIHHLLTHTSGLPEFSNLPGVDERTRTYASVEDILQQLATAPMRFPPGKEFKYCNSNYLLLGLMIEAVSGKSYEEFLRQRIFEPVKMTNTGCDFGETIISNRALGYSWKRRVVPAAYFEMRNTFGSGCLYSTAEDLFHFVEALAAGKLLSKSSLDVMFNPDHSEYGYGWFIAPWNKRRLIRHGGGMNGVSSDLRYLPDDHACVIVLSNVDATKASQVAEVLLRLALGEKHAPDTVEFPIDTVANLDEVRGDPTVAEACVGTYLLPMGEFIFTREGDKLFVKTPTDPEKAELTRESNMTFFIRGPAGVEMTFLKNAAGHVDEVKLTFRGREFRGKRKR